MHLPGRDQQLLTWPRALDLPFDVELHLPFQDDNQLVCAVSEGIPTLDGRVDPEFTTKPRKTLRTSLLKPGVTDTREPRFLPFCTGFWGIAKSAFRAVKRGVY